MHRGGPRRDLEGYGEVRRTGVGPLHRPVQFQQRAGAGRLERLLHQTGHEPGKISDLFFSEEKT